MKRSLIFLFILLGPVLHGFAQHSAEMPHLYKRMTLELSRKPLGEVLDLISEKGGFYFSYSGNTFDADSLVTLNVKYATVRDILDKIFLGKADYRESGRYVILRSTLLHFYIDPEIIRTDPKYYLITGRVLDLHTGKTVTDASVYERQLLSSTLTDRDGYFRLRMRGDLKSVILTVSKEAYRDTSMMFLSTVTIRPEGYRYNEDDSLSRYASNLVERLGLGRFLVSARQRVQSLNISGFLANSPFQASLIPGLSSHGMFSSQVVNKASLNLIGGYTAGVDGVEVAGVFNINKGDARQFQAAGVANIVGGSAHGFQIGGVVNSVLDSLHGFQAAGAINDVRKNADGFQIAAGINHVRKSMRGVQVSGLGNIVSGYIDGGQISSGFNLTQRFNGVQISGLAGIVTQEMKGIQISGLVNYSKNLKGLQIGLINIADTSSGVSIGLLNWVTKGYHKLSLSRNEVLDYQAGIKTGNDKLYSILMGGGTFSTGNHIYAAGLGFGHHMNIYKSLSLEPEISAQGLYLGNFDSANILTRGQLNLQLKIIKGVSIFAGPVYSIYATDPAVSSSGGFAQRVGPARTDRIGNTSRGWAGWNFGISLF